MLTKYTNKMVESEEKVKVALTCGPKAITYESLADIAGKTVGLDLKHTETLGSYQGEYLFLFTAGDNAFTSTTAYGSCSGCDTLEAIGIGYDQDGLRPEQVRDLYILSLDIVRNLKRVAGYNYDDKEEE